MAGIGAWEAQPPKEFLVVAIPHVGIVTTDWSINFRVLQFPIPFNIISNRGLPIDRARDDLVKQAQSLGASHLFFLDSDVTVPQDGVCKLFGHRLPIVCGVYGSKHGVPGVWIETAKSGDGRYCPVQPGALEAAGLFHHPDIVVGAGCCLVQMDVFLKLPEPWFLWTQGRQPGGISEDFYFFEQVRKAGIPVHVDTTVRCGHVDFTKLDWTGAKGPMQS